MPDVVVVDIELPNLGGNEILNEIMSYEPLPVVMTCSSTQKAKLSIVQGMELGAVDFVPKPASYFPQYLEDFIPALIRKLKIANMVNVKALKAIIDNKISFKINGLPKIYKKDVVVFGLDNVAIEAFRRLIEELPKNFPCILAVLDMPGGYTKAFADRLNEVSNLTVKEVNEKDGLEPGRVLIAPGGFHMKVERDFDEPYIELSTSAKVNGKRPSIDTLMLSVAENVGAGAVGVLFSGIGEDGVVGMKAMKMSGADTIIINPESSILGERLFNAVNFESHTNMVDFVKFPELLCSVVK
jgi:two-component system chemotaxis response regulator CheB